MTFNFSLKGLSYFAKDKNFLCSLTINDLKILSNKQNINFILEI